MSLKLTDNILDIKKIFNNDIIKYYYKISNSDILLQILSDEYQYLTCNLYSKFFRSFVENYSLPFKTEYNEILTIKKNNIYINDYILLPVGKYYKFGINSAYYYYYLNILKDLPENSDVVVVQTIGPWEIDNNILHMFFELENLLVREKNCNVKTIFLLISYGEKIEYENIIIDNNEKKDYIIINCNDYNNFNKIQSYINLTSNIIVDSISLYSNKSCYNELATLPLLILLYNKLLKCLKLEGNFYLNIKTFIIYKPYLELLYNISTLFDKFNILLNDIVFLHLGIFKFSNYKKYINNTLDKIITKYIKKDKYLGQNFFPKDKIALLNCSILDKNKNIPNKNILIKSILKINISNDFINIFIKAYRNYNKQLKKNYNKIIYIKSLFETGKKYKILKNINLILINNISKCLDYCDNKNIEINDIYINPEIPNYIEIINKFFPKKKNIENNKLEIAIDSSFSISTPYDLTKLSKLILKNTPSIKYIIDGNSNIGIGAIIFSEYFKHIHAVEYNKITFDKLKNNIDVYKLNNVSVIHEDIIKFMNDNKHMINKNMNEYCLFLDPPWSGYFYKINKVTDLYLNDINILDLLKEMNIKYIYMKVPHNYNFSKLFNLFFNVTIYRFSGYYIIFIIKE